MPPTIDNESIEARADARINELGALLSSQLSEMSTALLEHLSSMIEPLRGDESLQQLLYASIESNLETLVHVMRYDISIADSSPPPAAAEYARRLAQRGISSTALIRAYRLGQQLTVDWALERFAELEPERAIALAAGRRFAQLTFGYIDAISEGVVSEYEDERERWLAHRGRVRADIVEQLVSGQSVGPTTAEKSLGYRLRGHHVAVSLWTVDSSAGPDEQPRLETLLKDIADRLGATGRALFLARDRNQAWGWIPFGRDPVADTALASLLEEPSTGLRAALGTCLPGVEGFRVSHLEALAARGVALAAAESAPCVTSYGEADVRTAALMAADPEQTRRLVERALGALAVDTEAADRLRDTLLTFLDEQGSYLATAKRVHLHKNTVKYRVDRAIEERGRPLDEDRLELELALVACKRLGSSVISIKEE